MASSRQPPVSSVQSAAPQALAAMAGTAYAAYAPVKGNPADSARLLSVPIEQYRYDRATRAELGVPARDTLPVA